MFCHKGEVSDTWTKISFSEGVGRKPNEYHIQASTRLPFVATKQRSVDVETGYDATPTFRVRRFRPCSTNEIDKITRLGARRKRTIYLLLRAPKPRVGYRLRCFTTNTAYGLSKAVEVSDLE